MLCKCSACLDFIKYSLNTYNNGQLHLQCSYKTSGERLNIIIFLQTNPFWLDSSFSCICSLFKFPCYYSDIPIIYYFILKLNLNQLLLVLHNSVLNHQIYLHEKSDNIIYHLGWNVSGICPEAETNSHEKGSL